MTTTSSMVELCSPESEPELAVLRSILQEAGIPHFVHNDTFGSLVAGPRIALYNRKRILVAAADLELAASLLVELRAAAAPSRRPPPTAETYSLLDKLRMVAEFLLFGWFMPGNRPRPTPPLRLVKGFAPEAIAPDSAEGSAPARDG